MYIMWNLLLGRTGKSTMNAKLWTRNSISNHLFNLVLGSNFAKENTHNYFSRNQIKNSELLRNLSDSGV